MISSAVMISFSLATERKTGACKLPIASGDLVATPEVTLHLDPMELGLSCRYRPSWRDRMQNLLGRLGPFRLGYLEALLRIADWRASRKAEDDALALAKGPQDNTNHDLDSSHSALAQASARGTAPHSSLTPARQGGAEHGVRRRTGEPGNPGTRTRPPHSATRYLNTTLGVLSYAELAPHLQTRVAALQKSIVDGEFDGRAFDEYLLQEVHRRICGDLTPNFASRWRRREVQVGEHRPQPRRVPMLMRNYAAALSERVVNARQASDFLVTADEGYSR